MDTGERFRRRDLWSDTTEPPDVGTFGLTLVKGADDGTFGLATIKITHTGTSQAHRTGEPHIGICVAPPHRNF